MSDRKTTYELVARSGKARAGVLHLPHGDVPTPIFMPVGTQATVKALTVEELEQVGAHIVLGNTYHLWLRPGLDVVDAHGGLHRFMHWRRPMLTDSGGYQVFSLRGISRIDEQGVLFRSHLDGTAMHLTPETSMHIQQVLGADIAMAFDHCPPADAPRAVIVEALERTTRWAQRCVIAQKDKFPEQLRFGIVQGGTHVDLRRRHIAEIGALGFDGLALGGLAVGEPPEVTWSVMDQIVSDMPADRARYVMGIGTPRDLVEAIAAGVDMFDCVMPTRNARNGQLFTTGEPGGKLKIANARYARDLAPVEEGCPCPTCAGGYSRAYLRHLFQAGEILYHRLATVHNVAHYLRLVRGAREAILEDRFDAFARAFRSAAPPADEPADEPGPA